MIYSKDERLQSISLSDFWTIMLKTQQAVQLRLSLPPPFRYIFLFLMGLPQADEMLHQHKNLWSFKVVTRGDALILFFFSVFIYTFAQRKFVAF